MNQQRQQYRIPIERTGRLTRQGEVSECHVSDLTEQGFQVQTDLPLVAGAVIHLTCELDAHSVVECDIAVTHVRPPLFGGRIVGISAEHQDRLSRFIQNLIALTMMGLQRCLYRPTELNRTPALARRGNWSPCSV